LWCHDEFHYGERKAMALAKRIPYAFGTLMKYGYVYRHVAPLLRSKVLSWSHHYEVAPLRPDEQKYFLDLAAREDWKVRELRLKIKEDEHEQAMAGIHTEHEHRLWKNENSVRVYCQRVATAARIHPKLIVMSVALLEDYFQRHPSAFERFARVVRKAAAFWNARLQFVERFETKLNAVRDDELEAA
jgi:hypothetical protein